MMRERFLAGRDEAVLSFCRRAGGLPAFSDDIKGRWSRVHFPEVAKVAAERIFSEEGIVLRMVHVVLGGRAGGWVLLAYRDYSGKRVAALLACDERAGDYLQSTMDEGRRVSGCAERN